MLLGSFGQACVTTTCGGGTTPHPDTLHAGEGDPDWSLVTAMEEGPGHGQVTQLGRTGAMQGVQQTPPLPSLSFPLLSSSPSLPLPPFLSFLVSFSLFLPHFSW